MQALLGQLQEVSEGGEMNIIEAAKAMQGGATVRVARRPVLDNVTWAHTTALGSQGLLVDEDGEPVYVTLEGLLAEDYEVVP